MRLKNSEMRIVIFILILNLIGCENSNSIIDNSNLKNQKVESHIEQKNDSSLITTEYKYKSKFFISGYDYKVENDILVVRVDSIDYCFWAESVILPDTVSKFKQRVSISFSYIYSIENEKITFGEIMNLTSFDKDLGFLMGTDVILENDLYKLQNFTEYSGFIESKIIKIGDRKANFLIFRLDD